MSRLEGYFIPQLADVEEIREIVRVIDIEFSALRVEMGSVLNNMFILELDEKGCSRFENMLDIKPRLDDTLEDRRFRIQTLFKGDTPYTLIALKRKLSELCGAENVEISLDANSYTLKILIGLASKNQYNSALETVNKMKPCNIVLDYGLKYNQHSTLGKYTHARLASFTHEQLRSYVISIGG